MSFLYIYTASNKLTGGNIHVGNLIAIAHGSKVPSELAAIRMVDKDLLYEVLAIGHTKAWYETLIACDGGELLDTGKEEL